MAALAKVNPDCAGVDIGNEAIFIGLENHEVVSFGTFTDDYLKAIAVLKEHQVRSVVMEATGVYWVSFFDLLEAAGFAVTLVNGRQVKFVPGRKSDVADCQWLQQLHSFGLLRSCFVPDQLTRSLRIYTRLRSDHLQMASMHVQHMHKALTLMNIKVQNVLSELTGVSGRKILDAILAGERDPQVLAALCDQRILTAKRAQVEASLKGTFKGEQLFALKQAVAAYDFYQEQIHQCDKQIEALLQEHTEQLPPPPDPLTPEKRIRHNAPEIDQLHKKLMTMTGGRDPSQITGLSDKLLLELLAETGTDLKKHWPTEKHFASWLGLAPAQWQSGKSTRRRTVKKNSRGGQLCREGALSVSHSKHVALGAFFRRMRAKKGFRHALKATAHKIAIYYYRIMTEGLSYVERGIEHYEQHVKEQQLRLLKKKAKTLGLQLVPL